MELTSIAIIGAVMFVAMLYSSVGHGGASGYLAVMALFSISPAVTRPTALVLNLVVAGIAFVHFAKNGHFVWRTFWPFAAASIPFAYLGGKIDLATNIHKTILGVVLLLTAFRMAVELKNDLRRSDVPLMAALAAGAAIGLVSGVVGVGGGIFLTPILILMRWAESRDAAGISALFILVNSAAGLAGLSYSIAELPTEVYWWLAAAIAGGFAGSMLGSGRFDAVTLRRVLAVVLVIAGTKLLLV